MKRKKEHKNTVVQKDNNPFDEIWVWLRLASIPVDMDITCGQGKHDLLRDTRVLFSPRL